MPDNRTSLSRDEGKLSPRLSGSASVGEKIRDAATEQSGTWGERCDELFNDPKVWGMVTSFAHYMCSSFIKDGTTRDQWALDVSGVVWAQIREYSIPSEIDADGCRAILFTFIKNECSNHQRRYFAKKHQLGLASGQADMADLAIDNSDSSDVLLEKAERAEKVKSAVRKCQRKLNIQQRAVFDDWLLDISFVEIAKNLKITKSRVSQIWKASRELLSPCLESFLRNAGGVV